ncbi:actin-binding LIM protein 3-like isoform X1 [Sycon ciliatum]|uniref:actin-binding LIM protein 3-like isoform X1 n=1 Tax=Sycon ciliatum TaxID=27933 RepID=UPI0031F6920C
MPSITVQIPRPAGSATAHFQHHSLARSQESHNSGSSSRALYSRGWSATSPPVDQSGSPATQLLPCHQQKQPVAACNSTGSAVLRSRPGQRRTIRVDCSDLAANLAAAAARSSAAAPQTADQRQQQRTMVRGSSCEFDVSQCTILAKGVIIVDRSAELSSTGDFGGGSVGRDRAMNCAGLWRKLQCPPARKSSGYGRRHAGLRRSKSAPRRCKECDKPLVTGGFFMRDDNFYCSSDYQRMFGTRCQGCGDFVEGDVVVALDKTYHQRCFICHSCGKGFPPGESVTMQGDECICENCFNSSSDQNERRCAGCEEEIKSGQALLALNKQWHVLCFRCQHCGDMLSSEYMGRNGQPYCVRDYHTLFGVKCAACNCFITGRVLQAGENFYHPHCSQCVKCGGSFGEGEDMYIMHNDVWHPECGHLPNLSDSSESASLGYECTEQGEKGRVPMKSASPISVSSAASSPEPSPAQMASEISRATRLGSRRSVGEASDRSSGRESASSGKLFDWRSRYSVDSSTSSTPSTAHTESPAVNELRRQSLASGVSSVSSNQGSSRLSNSTSGSKLMSSMSTDSVENNELAPGRWHRSSLGSESRRRLTKEFSEADEISPITEVFPLDVLQGVDSIRLPKSVDRTRLEEYLSEEDFVKTFDMPREEFKRLQVWKRREMKKRARLF